MENIPIYSDVRVKKEQEYDRNEEQYTEDEENEGNRARLQEAERAEQEDAIQYTEDEECEYRRVMDSLEQQGFGFNPAQRKKT